MVILLSGISNVGKTTTAKLLADRLGYDFYDLDEEVKKHCGTTLEVFINSNPFLYERDKIRGVVINKIMAKQGKNKVVAITPMYYSRNFSTHLKDDDVLAIELKDTPDNIFDRLVFSDENDVIYKDDEYKMEHMAYYLSEIKKDITFYKNAFKKIENKYRMDGKCPEEVVQDIIDRYIEKKMRMRLKWTSAEMKEYTDEKAIGMLRLPFQLICSLSIRAVLNTSEKLKPARSPITFR